MRIARVALLALLLIPGAGLCQSDEQRIRIRQAGVELGRFQPGWLNAITDVPGVLVGHFTLKEPPRFNTGITAILPHGGNLYLEKVPAAIAVGNGYGKLMGSTQVNELGELETPILLTGTLNVPKAADALMSYMLSLPGMEEVYSINPVVGETNDGYLSDIRARPLGLEEVVKALESADGSFAMGAVGAGSGTICFGFKGGIGSSSRKLPETLGGWTVGVLVQSNFGGDLRVGGVSVGPALGKAIYQRHIQKSEDGSCMIVIATDAPLTHRNLKRLAERSFLGLARTGGYASNGSGDYAIAFSTHPELRITSKHQRATEGVERIHLDNAQMSPLFLAVVEATEEAILDSLFLGTTTEGHRGTVEGLPVKEILKILGESDRK